ncbi:MAG: transporter associated domain-containing protein, partial [Chitinophagales bacterium]
IKDLLEFLGSNKSFKWQSTLREPSFTSESKKIDDLLREIQISKQHMYIVADEYGGTLGLLSLEDILEEVVGEINDEFDDDEEDVRRNKDGSFLFDGKTSIIDVCKTIGVESSRFEEEKGGSDTLAGLILENLGSMPEENDTIFIDEFEFKVLEIEKNRIKKIYLKINEIEEE